MAPYAQRLAAPNRYANEAPAASNTEAPGIANVGVSPNANAAVAPTLAVRETSHLPGLDSRPSSRYREAHRATRTNRARRPVQDPSSSWVSIRELVRASRPWRRWRARPT